MVNGWIRKMFTLNSDKKTTRAVEDVCLVIGDIEFMNLWDGSTAFFVTSKKHILFDI